MSEFIECPHCGILSLAEKSDEGARCGSCGQLLGAQDPGGAGARRAFQVRLLQRIVFACLYARYFILAGLVLLFIYHFYIYTPRYRKEVGPVALAAPYQKIRDPLLYFPYKGNKIILAADFAVEARVLSLGWRLPVDNFARLSPVDVAVGWGFMAEEKSAAVFKIHHVPAARQLLWTVSWSRDEARLVNAHVANIHTIPASPEVEKKLRQVRVGDIVVMQGYLVAVVFPDRSYVQTSLSRMDTGDGACEVLWLEKLEIL